MAEVTFPVRRANPRFLFSAEAEAVLKDGTSVGAQVFELSLGGCYIDTVNSIPVGAELLLRIRNGANICEIPAKAIYMHSGYGTGVFGTGIVFENMPTDQRAALESWLRELADGSASKSSDQPTA